MREVTKIVTNDEREFDNKEDAVKYLEIEYGKILTAIAHKIVGEPKYVQVCEFINENLDMFHELIDIREEIKKGVEDNE